MEGVPEQTPHRRRPRRGSGRPPQTPEEREASRARRLERHARRRALVPEITYPEHLPVVARKDDIAAAIRDHQVVVIAGETGSGKTTQIPKICLELGRGIHGTIGHTQPRRIAARSVAERIAEELGHPITGDRVDGQERPIGYQVRFGDHATRDTLVKVMTDGILLAEMQHDRDLRRYDTIIIDEAHERSLNIDFILGYLKQLLPRRPDLKVIVTSATIDPERFAAHFAAADGTPAPIIEVSGRTYPVEVRYRPLERELPTGRSESVDQVTGIVDAVTELWTEAGAGDGSDQDVLVFCSGEREIRDAAEALEGLRLPGTEILPLYARLSSAEQHRVFSRHTGRRVVLATNVAETSLTVPGIRYVVDTGVARISRYSQRTKVQRLPIEPVSRASAAQRAGRCGRVSDGICIRLYSEEDFAARPEFTDPEILRTNLASVILQMISLGLGDVARFPFVDPPDSRQVADGLNLLLEIGAIDAASAGAEGRGGRRLTAYGRQIAALPVDPRLARMILEAHENGCLAEVLVITAALSIQDPRERPADKQAQADQQHARFTDEHSDFITWLNLWGYLQDRQRELSGSAFRRTCKQEYLHYLRIREWQDLHAQLRQACKTLRLEPNTGPASADAIHQALLSGLLSHIGLRDAEKREYAGARGARFAIQPGSVLHRRQPDWVMSAELVETTRLWARTNARIDPAWAERLGSHLVRRSYAEPHWSRKRASGVALERVTLYGVPLVAGRTVGLGHVDPELARELFIRHALVEGDWDTHHEFFHANRALLAEVAELEERARRRDILVDDDELFDFYDARIPQTVVSGRHFDSWWKQARREQPELLTFTEDVVVAEGADTSVSAGFPQQWVQGDLTLRLTYQFEPGADADGVTCHIPVEVLNRVRDEGFDWLVPGMREELATALIRALPKATRKHLVPAPDHARAALAAADPAAGDLTDELARVLRGRVGVVIPPGEWDWDKVPDHLRMTFRVEDRRGRTLGESTSLEGLRRRLAPQVRQTMASAAASIERTGLTTWDFESLPATFEQRVPGGRTLHGYPALVDRGTSVSVQVLATEREAAVASRLGLRRLLLLDITPPWKRVLAVLTNQQKIALGHNPHGSVPALLDDCLAAAIDSIVAQSPELRDQATGIVRDKAAYDEVLRRVRQLASARVIEVIELVEPVLVAAREARLALDRLSPAARPMRDDMAAQLDALVHPGFVAEVGHARLRHVARYVRAICWRAQKGPDDMRRDAERQAVVATVERERRTFLEGLRPSRVDDPDVQEIRWMVEELRVSLFAQPLGTAHPVSEQRIYKAMDAAEARHPGE
ncbi:ATP-dependent RNA helicase HrpA [Arsenicicoccus dermatophilus]|uniref:ATP-dependent RNA helicase HrpA n=1 Tax=Arsenicicoccus dermatophilus TaxID=1076331 RepID=UPI0039171066